MKPLFPPLLPPGSKGPAVVVLQLLLRSGGYNPNIILDGDFGDQTRRGVRALQDSLAVESDGHFGPQTRKAYLVACGIDVDALDSDLFVGETTVPAES